MGGLKDHVHAACGCQRRIRVRGVEPAGSVTSMSRGVEVTMVIVVDHVPVIARRRVGALEPGLAGPA